MSGRVPMRVSENNNNIASLFNKFSDFSIPYLNAVFEGIGIGLGGESSVPAIGRTSTSGIDTVRAGISLFQGIRGRNRLPSAAESPSNDGGIPNHLPTTESPSNDGGIPNHLPTTESPSNDGGIPNHLPTTESPSNDGGIPNHLPTTESPSNDGGIPNHLPTTESLRHGKKYYDYKKIALPALGFFANALTSISSGLSIGGSKDKERPNGFDTAAKVTGVASALIGGLGSLTEGGRHVYKLFRGAAGNRTRQGIKTIADVGNVGANIAYAFGSTNGSKYSNLIGDALSFGNTLGKYGAKKKSFAALNDLGFDYDYVNGALRSILGGYIN